MAPPEPQPDNASERLAEFIQDLRRRGISQPSVLEAMAAVPRERFVADDLVGHAYEDRPLPIGYGQTISQPFMVAYMAQAAELTTTDHVLEVGTGSGYGAAVLANRAKHVVSIERVESLAEAAKRRLATLGIDNVSVVVGDGTLGWPSLAPYDAIVVTAAGPKVPDALTSQLGPGGRLVIPVGGPTDQHLIRIVRDADDGFNRQDLGAVRFVPLIGEQGTR